MLATDSNFLEGGNISRSRTSLLKSSKFPVCHFYLVGITKMFNKSGHEAVVIMKKIWLSFLDTYVPFFWHSGTEPTREIISHLEFRIESSLGTNNTEFNCFNERVDVLSFSGEPCWIGKFNHIDMIECSWLPGMGLLT